MIMVYKNYKRIAVIGAGISGIAAANVLKKNYSSSRFRGFPIQKNAQYFCRDFWQIQLF
jgi:UDP-N-acetylmuramoylalanine-D-glutamate ligase